jgi:hypothetical protein
MRIVRPRVRVACCLFVLAGSAVAQESRELAAAPEVSELTSWAAPPLWTPPLRIASPEKPDGLHPESVDVIPTPPLSFVAVSPCRIVDTRGNGFTGQAGPPILSVGVMRTFQVSGVVSGIPVPCGIPPSAQAVSFQFTATAMNSNGNLIAWPEGAPPTTSVLNWNSTSVAIGSGTVVGLSASGTINVQLNGSAGASAHLIVDVNGYYGGSLVTSVAAGTGLTGGGTGAVTLGIANLGVGTGQLATGAVTGPKISVPLSLTGSASISESVLAITNNGSNGKTLSLTGGQFAGDVLSITNDGGAFAISSSSLSGGGIFSASATQTAVHGFSSLGIAMKATGAIAQDRETGGWLKGLVRMLGGAPNRCYNSQGSNRAQVESCTGFSITGSAGSYIVTFPFRVDDRYVVVTAESTDTGPPRCCMVQYNFTGTNTQVQVRTWDETGAAIDRAFTLAVF